MERSALRTAEHQILQFFRLFFLAEYLQCAGLVHAVLRDRIRDKDKDPSFSAKQDRDADDLAPISAAVLNELSYAARVGF
jgi:hypothetical protein